MHCNVSVLHHTGKCTAMSSHRIARDSFCYCLRPKEMHSPVERTFKKVHSIVERTSPRNKTEPLSGQKWTSRHSFFCMSNVFWGGIETWIQQQCTSFSCYFALYRNIALPDRLPRKTHTYTQNHHEHTVLKWGWHRQQQVSPVDCRPRGTALLGPSQIWKSNKIMPELAPQFLL